MPEDDPIRELGAWIEEARTAGIPLRDRLDHLVRVQETGAGRCPNAPDA